MLAARAPQAALERMLAHGPVCALAPMANKATIATKTFMFTFPIKTNRLKSSARIYTQVGPGDNEFAEVRTVNTYQVGQITNFWCAACFWLVVP